MPLCLANRLFDQLSPLRCALAHDELEAASALAADIDDTYFENLFFPRGSFRVNGGPRVTPENWPDLELTTERFAAIRGDREFRKSTWSDFARLFAVSPDRRAFFADYATELDTLNWPKLFEQALSGAPWASGDKQEQRRLQAYLQERGRDLLEAVPIATYATVRAVPMGLVRLIDNTFGAAGLEWFALEVVRFMVLPKTPKIRRTYAAELLKEITRRYPRLVIDVNVELEP